YSIDRRWYSRRSRS
ncbi:binding--dependent transport system inner membrane component family protein, partial [Chlamydia psittaci C1/97]